MFIIAHNASPVLGGGEIFLARLLAGLQRRGHRVLLFCRNSTVAEQTAAHGIPTKVLRLGGDLMLPQALGFGLTLRRLAPDVLLLTTLKKAWLGGLGARLARVPRVVARIAISKRVPWTVTYRVALERFVHVIAVNAETIRTQFLESATGYDASRVVTIYDGVDAPRPGGEPGALRRSLGLGPDASVIGTVARLTSQKRHDRLLHAVAGLPGSVHCIIAGEGPERGALEALSQSLGVQNRVHFLGFRDDIGDVLTALDVFVLTSDFEGMANAMLEAMALGIPVVTTSVSGAVEALGTGTDGTPGTIVGFDSQELARAILELLDDPELRRSAGAAGLRRARERFSFERMLDRWEALCSGRPVAGIERLQI